MLLWLVKDLCGSTDIVPTLSNFCLCLWEVELLGLPFSCSKGFQLTSHESPKVTLCQVMRAPRKNALIISSHVTGLERLEGAYKNAEDASKVLRRMKIPAECQFGGRISLTQFMEKIEEFFEIESEVHILWGIFHGKKGCWVLSNKELVSLYFILQKWYARDKGTAHHLLIVSDACESGHMVTEATELALKDVSVQASCHPNFTSHDGEEECFSDLLVWRLERRHGVPFDTQRALDMKVHLERSILNCHQPCFYSAVSADDLGWTFLDVHSTFSEDPFDGSDSATLSGSICDSVISVSERDDGSMSVNRDPSGTKLVFLLSIFSLILSQLLPPSRRNHLPWRHGVNQMLKDSELSGIPSQPRRLRMPRFQRAGLEVANYHKSFQPLMPWTRPWRRIWTSAAKFQDDEKHLQKMWCVEIA